MKEFKDKVAVVTGAASGIGRALAERCVQEGMKVVLADVEEGALAQAEKELKQTGADVLAVLTNVAQESAVEALAHKLLRSLAKSTCSLTMLVLAQEGLSGRVQWQIGSGQWA